MTTPDPIALPELPKSLDSVRVMGRWEQDDAAPCDDYYTADQMRAYGQACVEALTREAPKEGLEDEWKPIDSAPKDGSYILVANSHGAWVAKWHPVYQSGYRPSNPWASMMLNHDHIAKPGRFDHPAHWRELKAPAMTPDMARVDVGRGDYQDKALAWDAVCVALNTYCPGWANNSAKTGLQSAVDAIEALTPAPQVPGDMVLVPREATGDMLDAMIEPWLRGAGTERECLVAGWKGALSAAPSTPPLNELLGQREEFNLNEVSGSSGQFASLEQRARELLTAEMGASTTDDKNRVPLEYALRAITAALSAQPRGVEVVGWVPDGWKLVLVEPSREMVDAGVMFGISPNKASIIYQSMVNAVPNPPLPRDFHSDGVTRTSQDAAPQPREVRGVDRSLRTLIADDGYAASFQTMGQYRAALLAFASQDAAGVKVEPVAWRCREKNGSGIWRYMEYDTRSPDSYERRECEIENVYANPSLGVDVAALRQIAGELRDNAHHHQQEDREVGIFADEQEAQFNTELAERIERALTGDAAAPGVQS